MYIYAQFYKILMVLGFNLYAVNGYEPTFSDRPIDIKDSDGNSIQIHNSLNCYAQYYTDVRCTNSGEYVAPIIYLYGIKPMTFQEEHNCSSPPLSKECCEPTSNDCVFKDTKDIIEVWKTCGYKDHCKSLTGGRNFISESKNHKCTKEFLNEGGTSTSQYSYLRYACLPRKMEVDFDGGPGGNGKGKALLLKTKEAMTYSTGIKLQCTITGKKGVVVEYVDLRLCDGNNGVCNQTLSVGAHGQEHKGSKFGLEPLVAYPGQTEVILTFTRQSPTTKYHILLYVTSFDGSSDIEINCEQPLPITTTTTTTTTTTAPPTTTATTEAPPTTTTTTAGTGPTRTVKREVETTPRLHSEESTISTGVTEKSEDRKLKEQLIKYGEIAGAAVAGFVLASFICHCRYKHRRNKQQIDDNRPLRLDPLAISQYPRLGPVGAASQPSIVTDFIESTDSVSQVAERKRRRRKKKTSVVSCEIVNEDSASSRATLIQILLKKLEDHPDFAVEIIKHCSENGEDSIYKVGSPEFTEQIKTVLETLATETLIGSLHELGHSGESDNTLL